MTPLTISVYGGAAGHDPTTGEIGGNKIPARSGAFAIPTPIGSVGYTGDLRMYGHSRQRTELFAEQLAALKPALLICEGTSLRDEPATGEPTVHEAAREVVARERGLVIAESRAAETRAVSRNASR